MQLTLLTCCAALLACGALGMPPLADRAATGEDPAAAEQGEYFQGDIMEPYPQISGFAGLLNPENLWPLGEVAYRFDPDLPAVVRINVLLAMSRVTQETGGCARFKQWSPLLGDTYVLIKSGSGCAATIGYWSGRVTSMSLAERCTVGSIMHELQHTLGVEHQQSRPDRDNYVKIEFGNITPGYELNFLKESNRYFDSYGQAYDFGSQMHYSLTAFSKNGLPTIQPLPGRLPEGVEVGQRDHMSSRDVALLRAMYKCA